MKKKFYDLFVFCLDFRLIKCFKSLFCTNNKMPFKAPEITRCPKCNKAVYAAEEGKDGKKHIFLLHAYGSDSII